MSIFKDEITLKKEVVFVLVIGSLIGLGLLFVLILKGLGTERENAIWDILPDEERSYMDGCYIGCYLYDGIALTNTLHNYVIENINLSEKEKKKLWAFKYKITIDNNQVETRCYDRCNRGN